MDGWDGVTRIGMKYSNPESMLDIPGRNYSGQRIKKSRIRRCGFFRCSYGQTYFLAGAAAGAGAGSVVTSSFFKVFLTFFAFLVLTDFFTSFLSVFISPAGVTALVSVLTSDFMSAAQTIPAKETATRAATMVERTFFMCTTS